MTSTPLFLTARGTDQLRPWTVSYSQLSLVEACPRKWWFKYVKQMPDPTGAGAAFGSKLHALAEKRVTEGVGLTDDRIGKLIALAENRGYIPTHEEFLAANGQIKIEYKFKALMGHGVDALPLTGAVDILDVTDPDRLYTGDHKTGKSLRYVKTEEQLRLDQQLSIYLKVAVDEHYGGKPPPVLEASHIAYLSEGPFHVERVGPVSIPWEQVQNTWSGIEKQVPVIRGLAVETSVDKIPGNKARCNDYGGCPFRDVCHATLDATSYSFSTPNQKKEDMSTQETPLTALQRLQALKNRNAAGGGMNPGRNVAPATPTPEPSPTPAPVEPPMTLQEGATIVKAALTQVADPAKKVTLEDYQKNFKAPEPKTTTTTTTPPIEKVEAALLDSAKYALAKRGFTEQQIGRASVETVRVIMDEGYGAEDCSILPNGDLKVFKPMEGAVRSIDPVRAEERRRAIIESKEEQDAVEAELLKAAEERRRLALERAEQEIADQKAQDAQEAERLRKEALAAEAKRVLKAGAVITESGPVTVREESLVATDPRTNGESFGYTDFKGSPLQETPATAATRTRKKRGSRQLLVDQLKLYSLREYDEMSLEAVEMAMADVERQLREGAGSGGDAPPVRRPVFGGNTPERKAEIEADARYEALTLKGMPTMTEWNEVGVIGFVWRHGDQKVTHFTELEHFLRDLCRAPGGTFALDFGPEQTGRRKFIKVELDLLTNILKTVFESLTAEQKATGSGVQVDDPTFEAPPKVTAEQIQTLTMQMGQQVFILVDAMAQWACPMEQHLLPAMQGYEKKKNIPFYDMAAFNEGAKFVAACLMLEDFALEPGNWYSICGQHPWRQYVMEILSRDPRVRFIYGTR